MATATFSDLPPELVVNVFAFVSLWFSRGVGRRMAGHHAVVAWLSLSPEVALLSGSLVQL